MIREICLKNTTLLHLVIMFNYQLIINAGRSVGLVIKKEDTLFE